MKKLLSGLMTISLMSSVGIQVVACNSINNNIVSLDQIGLNIDRSNAIDNDGTTYDKNNSSISNYYVLGDSLLDSGGIERYLGEETNGLIDLQFANSDNDVNNYNQGYNHAFTNGLSAGVELGREIFNNIDYRTTTGSLFGQKEINPQYPSDETKKVYGNNYAIGGSTSANLVSWTLEAEARSLVAQHKFQDNDLIFCDIGGNDMFSLIDDNNTEKDAQIIEQFKTGLENSLLTLLNNGAKRILYMTPPQMIDTQKYYNEIELLKTESEKEAFINRILILDQEIYSTIQDVLTEVKLVNENYDSYIQVFDLYDYFHEFIGWDDLNSTDNTPSDEWNNFVQWQKDNSGNEWGNNCTYKIEKPHSYYVHGNSFAISTNESKQIVLNVNVSGDPNIENDNPNNSFFMDTVHPTWAVVQYICNHIMTILKEKGWVK